MFEDRSVKNLTPLEHLALNTLENIRRYLTQGQIERRAFMELMAEIRTVISKLEEKELGPGNHGRWDQG